MPGQSLKNSLTLMSQKKTKNTDIKKYVTEADELLIKFYQALHHEDMDERIMQLTMINLEMEDYVLKWKLV